LSDLLNFEHYPLDVSHLPRGWAVTSIGSVATEIESGFASGVHNGDGRGILHLRPMNIDRQGRLDLSVAKFVEIISPKTVRRGDVLFNNTNSPELVGKTTVITSDELHAFSNHMTRIAVADRIEPRFLAGQLHFLWLTGYFKHRCVNHVNQASISADPLSNSVPLFLPPACEQQRIADVLDELLSDLDAGLESMQRAKAKLALYRDSVLKEAAEGNLTIHWRKQNPDVEPASVLLERVLAERRRLWEENQLRKFKADNKNPPVNWKAKYKEPVAPDTAHLPSLPKGWCWASAEQICGFITKGTTPAGADAPAPEGEIPFIKVQHLSAVGKFYFSSSPSFISGTINDGSLARSRVFPGDVLMNIVGPPLGQVSIVPTDYPVWNVNQAIAIFRTVGGVSNQYLATCLSTHSVLAYALKKAKATAGQVNLTLEVCRELPVPLPPLKEQVMLLEAVDDLLSSVDHLLGDLDAKSEAAGALKQSIFHHAFTGQLVPQDSNDEPASELLRRIGLERVTCFKASASRGRRPYGRKRDGNINR
jgi:type I restriction enzyme, S subunit